MRAMLKIGKDEYRDVIIQSGLISDDGTVWVGREYHATDAVYVHVDHLTVQCTYCAHAARWVETTDGEPMCEPCMRGYARDGVRVKPLTPRRMRDTITTYANMREALISASRRSGVNSTRSVDTYLARLQASQRAAVGRITRKAA